MKIWSNYFVDMQFIFSFNFDIITVDLIESAKRKLLVLRFPALFFFVVEEEKRKQYPRHWSNPFPCVLYSSV